jgi:hypothetical protein
MTEQLTKRQRYWLKHIERAAERGETLKEYAKRRRISVGAMYQAKSNLMKLGVLPRQEQAVVVTDFVPVQIKPAAPLVRCRLRHRSGWEFECGSWPDPKWLRAVMEGEQGDASS